LADYSFPWEGITEPRPGEQQPAGGEEFLSWSAGFFLLNIITNG